MTRHERFFTRDLTYSQWHRSLNNDLTYIDLDGIEYCDKCKEPLLLVELAQDIGQNLKPTTVMRKLAEKALLPAVLVFYKKNEGAVEPESCIYSFRVQKIFPIHEVGQVEMQPSEFSAYLRKVHDEHLCKLRRIIVRGKEI